MCIAESLQSGFEQEMTALLARMQSSDEPCDRYAIFDALMDLEDRAWTGGASALTLRKIGEVRFLVGILRDAMRPRPVASLRTVLRICRGARIPGGAALGQSHAAAESAA